MNEYRVRWEIDIDADTPEGAVQEALRTQRDPTSLATIFEVYDAEGLLLDVVDASR